MTCFTIVHSERNMELAFNKDALQFEEVSDIDWCSFESVLLHISTLNFVFVSQVFYYQDVKCREEMYDKDIIMLQVWCSESLLA